MAYCEQVRCWQLAPCAFHGLAFAGFAAHRAEAQAESKRVMRHQFAVALEEGQSSKAKASLQSAGLTKFELNDERKDLIVESDMTSEELRKMLEECGVKAKLIGQGSVEANLGCAVCAVGYLGETAVNKVLGVVRFVQISENELHIDGTVDGLTPGKHGFHIHEFGDFSNGCNSTGPHYNPNKMDHGAPEDEIRHAGDLGNIEADDKGRASFRFTDRQLKVWDIIGRAVVVHAQPDDLGRTDHPDSKKTGNAGARVSCGLIARSAGVFENAKRICSCDGKTIWESEPFK